MDNSDRSMFIFIDVSFRLQSEIKKKDQELHQLGHEKHAFENKIQELKNELENQKDEERKLKSEVTRIKQKYNGSVQSNSERQDADSRENRELWDQ